MATQLLGTSTILANTSVAAANEVTYHRHTATATGSLTAIQIYIHTSAGSWKAAIYSNSSNNPNTKLGESGTVTVTTGWNVFTLASPVSVTSGTVYWLAWLGNSGTTVFRWASDAAFKKVLQGGVTYPNFPTTATPGSSSEQNWSIYGEGDLPSDQFGGYIFMTT